MPKAKIVPIINANAKKIDLTLFRVRGNLGGQKLHQPCDRLLGKGEDIPGG